MSDDYEEEAVSEDYPNEGYIEKLEAERDRLQAERDDWRDTAEDGAKMMRAEIERLRVCMAGEGERLTKSNRELRDENERLRAALQEIHELDARFGMARNGEKWMVAWCISGKALAGAQSGRKDETGEKPQSDQ